ncbi:MAG: HutD family protein [Amphritea sp.]
MNKSNVTHYRSNEYVERPWKNGQGTTLEVATCTDQTGNACDDWRISIASISNAGDYSDFSGYQRSQVMLQGEAVTLTLLQPDCEPHQYEAQQYEAQQYEAQQYEAQQYETRQYERQQIVMRAMSHLDFDGGVKISCKPTGGQVKMFNVMTRSDAISHRVNLISSEDHSVELNQGADTVLFFSLQNNLQIHVGRQPYQLSRYDLLEVNQAAEQALSLPSAVGNVGVNAGVKEVMGIMVSINSSPCNNAKPATIQNKTSVTFQKT